MSSPNISPHSNYETLYGVGLLDDLHNFFPALLYDSSEFHSVQDVLRYIQQQSRARFDLFSYGLREYQASHSPPRASVLSAGRSFDQLRLLQHIGQRNPSNLRSPTQIVRVNLDESQGHDADTEEEIEEEESTVQPQAVSPSPTNTLTATENGIASLLLELLNVSSTARTPSVLEAPSILTTTRNLWLPLTSQRTNTFLEPVIIRPSPEQIQQHTTVGNVASDQDITCAICQDNLQPEQEGRKLNVCGHWFHKICIDTWFERNVHCPVCRHDVRVSASPVGEHSAIPPAS